MPPSELIVGLDAGGSNTLLRGRWTSRSAPIECRGPGANPNRVGPTQAAEVLVDLIEEALRSGPPADALYVCAGVAGAGRCTMQETLADALRTALSRPGRTVHVEVVHDALIALDAAHGADSGGIIIAGTGSVVLARTAEGGVVRTGGWGPVLGDPGSGYALGRAGLRAVADALDGGPDTALCSRLRVQLGLADRDALLDAVYSDALDVQSVAPLVVEAAADGDSVASALLNAQVDRLVDQVEWILENNPPIRLHFTLLGGMLGNNYYAEILRQSLTTRRPDVRLEELTVDPVVGALRRAHRLAGRDRRQNS